MNIENIIEYVNKAKEKSYSPYSKFPVGAVLITEDDQIYMGTNIENASYGATMCAERCAVFNAICSGEKKENFKLLAIISNMKEFTYPCCQCRQVLGEFFSEDVEILMMNKHGNYKSVKINDLIPYKFTDKELQNV